MSGPTTCIRCGQPTSDPSRRCADDQYPTFGSRFRPARPSLHGTRRWSTLARRFREQWVVEHGWVCAGWRRARHPSLVLQVDHMLPMVARPDLAYTWANLQCLCPTCNARKSLHDRQMARRTSTASSMRAPAGGVA